MCDKEDVEMENKTAKDTNATMELNPVNFKQEYYLQYFFRFNETHFKKSGAKICEMGEIRIMCDLQVCICVCIQVMLTMLLAMRLLSPSCWSRRACWVKIRIGMCNAKLFQRVATEICQ